MEHLAVNESPGEKAADPGKYNDKYYSVEFCVEGPGIVHQFKIWRIPPMNMCLLIRKDSHILRGLREGDTFNMKYYGTESTYPPDSLQTTIRHITEIEQERFKDHCMVGLEILDSRN